MLSQDLKHLFEEAPKRHLSHQDHNKMMSPPQSKKVRVREIVSLNKSQGQRESLPFLHTVE